jgi:hypothetical protein
MSIKVGDFRVYSSRVYEKFSVDLLDLSLFSESTLKINLIVYGHGII